MKVLSSFCVSSCCRAEALSCAGDFVTPCFRAFVRSYGKPSAIKVSVFLSVVSCRSCLDFEILNLFGIWEFEFQISAGLPAVVCCLYSHSS